MNYSAVNFKSTNAARMFAQCRGFFFVNGGPPIVGRVFVQADVQDRGEPGTNDRACIDWGLHRRPNPGDAGVFVVDCGQIQSGNVQVQV
jgi:hypothetical protein